MKFILALFFLISGISPAMAYNPGARQATQSGYATEAEAEEFFASIGPKVNMEDMPILVGRLKEYLRRLNLSLRNNELIDPNFESELIILQSSQLRAATLFYANPSGNPGKQVVFFTTGLLKYIFAVNSPAGVAKAENALGPLLSQMIAKHQIELIGMMGHEVAHAIDKSDPYGVEQSPHGRHSMQPIEFRTDYEAIQILKGAGFPTNALYLGLRAILRETDPGLVAQLSQLTNSHPETSVRMSAQRWALTYDRVNRGEMLNAEPALTEAEAAQILQEVINLKTSPPVPFVLPADISHFFDPVYPLDGNDRAWVNALTLWFDNELMNNRLDVSDSNLENIRNWIMFQPRGVICTTRACLDKLFVDTNITGLKNLTRIAHPDVVRMHPFYVSPLDSTKVETTLMAGALPMTLSSIGNPGQLTQGLGHAAASYYLPNGYTAVDILRRVKKMPPLASISQIVYIADRGVLDATDFLNYALYFHQDLFRNWMDSAEDHASKYATENFRKAWGAGVFGRTPGGDELYETGASFYFLLPTTYSRTYWNSLFSRGETDGNQQKAKELLTSIWENRGMWAYLEFISKNGFRVDWDLVGNRLGISPDQLKGELQNAFKSYLPTRISLFREFMKEYLLPDQQPVLGSLNRPMWMPAKLDGFLKAQLSTITDSELKTDLTAIWMGQYYRFDHSGLIANFRNELDEHLKDPSSLASKENFWEAVEQIERDITAMRGWSFYFLSEKVDILVDEVWRMNTTWQFRRSLLQSIFEYKRHDTDNSAQGNEARRQRVANGGDWRYLNSVSDSVNYASDLTDATWKMLLQRAIRDHQANGVVDFINTIVDPENLSDNFLFEVALSKLSQDLVAEIKTMNVDELESLSLFIARRLPTNSFGKSGEIAGAMVDRYNQLALTPSQQLRAFWNLTKFSVGLETDSFFNKYLVAELKKRNDVYVMKMLLNANRFKDSQLRVDLTKTVLRSRLETENMDDLTKNIDQLLHGDSSARDSLFEELAWYRNITGEDLKSQVEGTKMTNWRKIDALVANGVSLVVALSQNVSLVNKVRIIDYLVSNGKDPTVLEDLLTEARKLILSGIDLVPKHLTLGGFASIDKKLSEIKRIVSQFIVDTSPIQRVPLVELLLTSGNPDIYSRPNLMTRLIEDHLKLAPSSTESIFLRAYLDTIPEEERSTQFAYMLLTSGTGAGGKMDLKSICEAFGTVGKKFCQMAAIWRIFGPQYQEELSQLFTEATPMTKYEIENILKQRLGQQYDLKIKRLVRILGSASIKTVVLAELQNGNYAALMIKGPHANPQTMTNLKYAKGLLDNLKRYGVESTHPLFLPLVEAMEAQIGPELDFLHEIENYKAARGMIKQIMDSFTTNSSKWDVEVPEISSDIPASDSLFATEAVSGISAKDFFKDASVPQAEKDEVGAMMVKVSLAMLFRYGKFDPDRHPGNWIIDRATHKIYFIDPGQLTSFDLYRSPLKYDGRLALAQFISALNDKDGHRMAEQAMNLLSADDDTKVDIAKVGDRITSILQTGIPDRTEEEELRDIVGALYDSDLKFDPNYTFGALKGLMVLSGSGYVSAENFKSIMKSEISFLYTKKIPVVIGSNIARMANRAKISSRVKINDIGKSCASLLMAN